MKAKKRFFGMVLAVCLMAGLMPTTALAAGTDTGKARENRTDKSAMRPGECNATGRICYPCLNHTFRPHSPAATLQSGHKKSPPAVR